MSSTQIEENLSSQVDEVEALSAIYGSDWIDDGPRRYYIKIAGNVRLLVRLTDDYPSDGPPYFELDAVELSGDQKLEICDKLNSLYAENLGESIIYIWVEAIREFLSAKDNFTVSPVMPLPPPASDSHDSEMDCPAIMHDDPVVDRKSTFQAHAAHVTSLQQVKLVIQKLLSNKKISSATHNIQAYRIQLPNGAVAEDCDDDGETHAGSRVLHLLNIVKAIDVIVVVSRWYGGIQLGPDRFKHINNCARNVLDKWNFITSSNSNSKNKGNKSRQT